MHFGGAAYYVSCLRAVLTALPPLIIKQMSMSAALATKKKPFKILASHVALNHFLVATPLSLSHPHSPPCGNSPRALLRGSGHVGVRAERGAPALSCAYSTSSCAAKWPVSGSAIIGALPSACVRVRLGRAMLIGRVLGWSISVGRLFCFSLRELFGETKRCRYKAGIFAHS